MLVSPCGNRLHGEDLLNVLHEMMWHSSARQVHQAIGQDRQILQVLWVDDAFRDRDGAPLPLPL